MHAESILGQEDTRRISGGYPEDIRRIQQEDTQRIPGGYPEDIRGRGYQLDILPLRRIPGG